ncbi:MAG: tRNA uridine-5-carboxymethylaminomethyl(34) synthesis enzyme MnmG [Clostridiales bacterium]|nr:tRNA uridine-5-carboxymethylaminomethyl(34) synthesis enzyme MnmG [Clostridiales bacterium]
MKFTAGHFDIIVIGAGHAGCEAGLVAARMGYKTGVFAISLDSIAMLACNPSIGGTSKGHLVREIDALGGQIGINADETLIQMKMLNTAKGPAVHSLRAQADKNLYHGAMKRTLERQENLWLREGEVVEILTEGESVRGVRLSTGEIYTARAVILASGVYLKSKIYIGEYARNSGPSGMFPANELSKSLKDLGFQLRRFKTGTPARVNKNSIDFSKTIVQPGDSEIIPFSFTNLTIEREQVPCHLTYTNEKTHEIIRENIHRSPMYSGQIGGTGARYCPSIEDKIVRFPDKDSHQIFLEPEGITTDEIYVQGLSTSLPIDVQMAMYRTVKGLENVDIIRPGYAIEYDCIDPLVLKQTLESKNVSGLFFAGQINGSSGYEEAAGQGLIAGVNAVKYIEEEPPLILDRSQAYIGVLIDDLTTKGTNEPYRMMTSRAEYRLLLRQDNADMRLTEIGYNMGIIDENRYDRYMKKKENIAGEIKRLKGVYIAPTERVLEYLDKKQSARIKSGISLYDLLKRPEIEYTDIEKLEERKSSLNRQEIEQIQVGIKYEGYIEKQMRQAEQFKKMERRLIPEDLDYKKVHGLRIEASQKLDSIRPISIGQASRISGVSPADISVLLIHLEKMHRNGSQ